MRTLKKIQLVWLNIQAERAFARRDWKNATRAYSQIYEMLCGSGKTTGFAVVCSRLSISLFQSGNHAKARQTIPILVQFSQSSTFDKEDDQKWFDLHVETLARAMGVDTKALSKVDEIELQSVTPRIRRCFPVFGLLHEGAG